MPAKYSIKQYLSNSYYHIFNRGVEKRKIFQDSQDYKVFLSYLKDYLETKNIEELRNRLLNPVTTSKEKDKLLKLIRLNNFHGEIQLLAYCLMPNHFHLLVKQKSQMSIDSFMKSLLTRYTIFFNKKYKRVGHLFQGRYKAVVVKNEEQLLHLSRYIHLNPARTVLAICYSSLNDYLKRINTSWIKKDEILNYFSKTNPLLSYENFMKESKTGENELIQSLVFA